MKKSIFILFAVISAALAGCASVSKSSLPDFVTNPPRDKEHYYGIGTANMGSDSLSITHAENRARVAIAQQIGTQARSMIDDYSANVEGDPKNAEKFAQTVSRTLAEAKLTNTETIKREVRSDGTCWVLMSMKKSDANRELTSNLDKEKLNYAEFKNWNAQREMDAAFDKQAGKKPPVIE